MPNKSLAIIAAIAVIGLLFLVYLAATFESPEGTRTVELTPPVPRAPEPVQRVETPAPAPVPAPVVPAPVSPAVDGRARVGREPLRNAGGLLSTLHVIGGWFGRG